MSRLPHSHFGWFLLILLTALMIGAPTYSSVTLAQGPPQQVGTPSGRVIIPPSSVENPADVGIRAHTNHLIFVSSTPQSIAGLPSGENPGSLACVYGLVPATSGCPTNPATGTFINPANPAGGVIAIVDAYHYPTAATDLATFSSTFQLPAANLQVVYAAGQQPSTNCGWNQETALDIEWAHAMSPAATIYLVEAASSSLSDLLAAVDRATSLVQAAGGGQVSMSWGSSEFRGETNYDSHFNTVGVAYFASAGDTGGKVIWPGTSANVVSAGGTRVNRDASGNFTSESAWSRETCSGGTCGGGGGPSRYEPRPPYQNVIQSIVRSARGTPDFSFDADPFTGVAVYENSPACTGTNAGWMVFGGTSVSSPALAGIVDTATGGVQHLGTGSPSYGEQGLMYTGYGSATYYQNFRDITSGNTGYAAKSGWDFATGIGSDQGLINK